MPWSGVLLHWICLLSCKKGNLANETIEEMSCKYRHMETACTLEFVLLLRDRAYHFVAWCEKHTGRISVAIQYTSLWISHFWMFPLEITPGLTSEWHMALNLGNVGQFWMVWFENIISGFIWFSHLDLKCVLGNTRPLPPSGIKMIGWLLAKQ